MRARTVRDIAIARSGDKGNRATLSLIARDVADYPLLEQCLSAERVKDHYRDVVHGAVTRYTLPVTLQQSVGGFDPSWGLFAAGSLLLSLPVVAVFFFVQRQMVEGMTAGAVKG